MYWGQLPFYNLQSLEKVLGTGGRGDGEEGYISERWEVRKIVSKFCLKIVSEFWLKVQCLL